jgi:hypothetical protein
MEHCDMSATQKDLPTRLLSHGPAVTQVEALLPDGPPDILMRRWSNA